MAYIGNRPVSGDNNSFRVLDDIKTYTFSFDGSSSSVVSTSDNTITHKGHRLVQGQRVTYTDGTGSAIGGLTDATVYFVIMNDANSFKLASSASNAAAGTAINLTSVGSGTSHTITVAFDGVNTKFKATFNNGTEADVTRVAQIQISLNNVIQQPQNTPTPTSGFGFESDSVIVFASAPASTVTFWGVLFANNFPTFEISDNDVDNFTGNGSTTEFSLSKSPASNENIIVTIDGVVQYPSDNSTTRAYNTVGNALQFSVAPHSDSDIQVRHIGFAGPDESGGVTAFYGRTGSVFLNNSDNIVVNDAEVTGNLTVQGDTTTLNTTLRNVELLRVDGNDTVAAGIITQRGSGDILKLYDSSTPVFVVTDGGKVGIGTDNPNVELDIEGASARIHLHDHDGNQAQIIQSGNSLYLNLDSEGNGNGSLRIRSGGTTGDSEIIRIKADGIVGIGSTAPTEKLDVIGNIKASGTITGSSFSGDGDFVDLDVDGQTDLDDLAVAGISTFSGSIKIQTSDLSKSLQIGDIAGSPVNYLGIQQVSGSSIKGFATQYDNASVFENLQGSFHQHLVLGDSTSGNNGTIFGISLTESGTNYERLKLTGVGDLFVASNLNLANDIIHTGDNTKIRFPSDDLITFETAGEQRLSINADGNVIIGTSSWNFEKALNVQGSSGNILSLYNGDTTTYAANTFAGIELKLRTGNTGNQRASCEIRAFKENETNGNSARALSFYTGLNGGSPTERLRITSEGEVRIANGGLLTIKTDAVATYGVSEALRIDDNNVTDDRPFQIFEYQNSGARWFTLNQNLNVTTTGTSYTYTQGNYSGSNMIQMTNGDLRIYGDPSIVGGGTSAITPTERVSILNNGKVLIGTTTEGHPNADDLTIANSGDTGITIRSGTSDRGRIYFSDATSGDGEVVGSLSYDHDNDSFNIHTGGGLRLTINSSGNLYAAGITTSNTGFQFGSSSHYIYQSASDTATLRVTSDGPYAQFKDVSGILQMGSASGTLVLSAGGAEKVRILTDGKVGIGTNDPSQLIDVFKTTNDAVIKTRTTAAGAYFEADSASSGYYGIKLSSSGTQKWFFGSYNSANFQVIDGGPTGSEVFTIEDGTGNIGIGTADPSYSLQVQSDGTSTTAAGNIVARFQSNGSGRDATIQLSDNVANSATISMLSSNLIFEQAGTETFRINSDGAVYVNQQMAFQQSDGATTAGLLGRGSLLLAGTQQTDFAIRSAPHNSNLVLGVGVTERLRIDSDGVVIINQTTASGTKLAIQSTDSSGSGTATGIRVGNNINVLSQYPANIEVRTTGVSTYNAIRTDAGDGNGGFTCGVESYNGFLDLTTGGSNDIRVKLRSSGDSYFNGGNVGIGSDDPHRKLVVAGNADMAIIGDNAGITLGTHPTGGFQSNAAITRAGSDDFHIAGSEAGDLCIASESGASMIFGVSPHAGAMNTFLHVSRLRNFNFYGADYKFHIGSTETVSITSTGQTLLTRGSQGGRDSTGNASNFMKIGTWYGIDQTSRLKITVFGTTTYDSNADVAGETIIYISNNANNTMKGHFHSHSNNRACVQKVAFKMGSSNTNAEVWIKYNGGYSCTQHKVDASEGYWVGADVDTGSTSVPSGATEASSFFAVATSDGSQSHERLRIQNNGNIGIGTDNPADILDINSDKASGVSDVYVRNHAALGGVALNLWTQGTYDSPQHKAIIGCTDSGGTIRMGAASNDPLLLLVNNDEKLLINTDGNVGINSTEPTAKLEVLEQSDNTYGDGVARFKYFETDQNALRLDVLFKTSGSYHKTYTTGSGTDFLIVDADNVEGRHSFTVQGNAGNNKSFTVDSTGLVGIGTENPDERLHVVIPSSTATVAKFERSHNNNVSIEYRNTTSRMYAGLAGDALGFAIDDDANLGVQPMLMVRRSTSYVGVNIANPLRQLDVVGNSILVRPTTTTTLHSSGNASAVNNSIIVRMPYGEDAATTSNAGARFGIQFTGANNTTDVASLNFGDDPTKSASIYGVSEDDLGYNRKVGMVFYTSGFDTAQTEKLRINSDGHVQIGTAVDPGNALRYLDVGNFNTGSDAGSILRLITRESDGTDSASGDIVKYKAGGLVINNNEKLGTAGYISFGTASNGGDTTQRLHISHNGTFTGSSSSNISDQRLKENIAMITDPIAKIKALKGRTFTWKTEASMREGTHYGFVAQELETVIPDLIVEDTGIRLFDKDDNLLPSNVMTPPVGGGYAKSVDADGVTPVLVEALKEALAKIETLEAKVAALEEG